MGTLTNVLSLPIVLFNILCCHNEMFESGCMAKNQKKPVNACVYILSYRRFCVTPYMINVTCSYSRPNTCNTYTFVFSSKRNVLMREKNVSISYILFHIASFLKTGVHKMKLYFKGDRMKIVSEVKTNKLSVIISVRIRREAAIRL